MCRRIFALTGLFVALTTAAAVAQEQPTYEGRGYGGPLGVGPNFQQGGQWGPPVYGQGQSKSVERYRAPQHIDRVQRSRNSDDDNVKTAKKALAPKESKEAKSQSENSSIVTIDHDKTTPAPKESKEAKSQSENSSIVTIGSDQDKTTPVTEQKKTDLAKSDNSKSSSENSTIASVASSTTANADPVKGQLSKRVDTDASGKTVATCKRYFPTVGQTITVPCD